MIDWDRVAALREEVGPEDFEEVVELFLEEVDAEIASVSDPSVMQELGAKLHFLKGSALSLGFSEFSCLCQEGESALSGNPNAVVNLQDLKNSYQKSRSAFLDDLPNRFAS
ncbi:MAG: Hpt domain-containing protein [Roseobacter sp.]